MQRKSALAKIVGAFLFAVLAGSGQAATPVSPVPANSAPKVQLNWLASLSFSPATVVVGSEVTGTVTLLRPAIENLQIAIALEGGVPNEAAQVGPGTIAAASVTVPVGASTGTFKVSTFAKDGVTLPKVHTVTVRYGTESKSASFTVVAVRVRTTVPH